MAARTIADEGEFGLIAAVTSGLTMPDAVTVGPGDDCAVFAPTGQVVVSTDALYEDVHFRKAWSGPHDVGRKAVGSALADVEAMGATPLGVVVALSAPPETPTDWVLEFTKGVREECELAGAALVGGDTTRGPAIGVVVTVFGDLQGRTPLLRSGARPGDVVAYVGRLGMAAAGLAVLGRGFRSPGAVVRAHRVPEVPYGQGRVASQAGATSLIDCSDGPLADLGHVARASGVAIDLDSGSLDVDEAQKTVAAAIGGGDPLNYILTGGDDHALLGTFAGSDVPQGWTVIGRVLPLGPDAEASVTVDGKVWSGDAGGWRHF
ncbi:thiamine-phosphate kinase [Propioniciclava sinopodophylli]|uniref:Thiamine-monophosphate kinase n=1 Tax=Propioniciclava sinopodophylli TaxID=1837344 RepID=A0A4Q9KBF1_9ACTN|nr:thiamine-phosphate kinase [Propioniciclava sinopodophylli]TBT83115.1 thiamine-phosphate kinase [Propioniciclava sinopodophylli]